MKKIYLKEFDCFGYEFEILANLDENMLKLFNIDSLNQIFDNCMKKEYYESATIVKKEIEQRR